MEIETYIRQLHHADWTTVRVAIDALSEINTSEVHTAMLQLLTSPVDHARDGAALVLQEVAYDLAVEPLIISIQYPVNPNNYGTLAYALTNLNCSMYFRNIFMLIVSTTYEAQNHLLSILDEQTFNISEHDIRTAKATLIHFAKTQRRGKDNRVLIRNLIDIIRKHEHTGVNTIRQQEPSHITSNLPMVEEAH